MTSQADLEADEHHMQTARHWITEGWTGHLGMASSVFKDELRTNGAHVGIAGPVSRIRDQPEADRVPPGERLRRLTGETDL
jgi:hypothetical protein